MPRKLPILDTFWIHGRFRNAIGVPDFRTTGLVDPETSCHQQDAQLRPCLLCLGSSPAFLAEVWEWTLKQLQAFPRQGLCKASPGTPH